MDKNTVSGRNGTATSRWEDEGGAAVSERPEREERRDPRRRGDDTAQPRPNDEVPANRREDPDAAGRDEDEERKDRRSS